MAATAADLRDFRAAGVASSTTPAEVDRVWRMFAGGIYSKSIALQILNAAPEMAAPAQPISPAATVSISKTDVSASIAPSASPEDRLASEIVALYLGKSSVAGPATADETAAAAIVHLFHS